MARYDQYIPILKGKKGEFDALKGLAPKIKSKIIPFIDVPSVPLKYPEGIPKESLEKYLKRIAHEISLSWEMKTEIYIDFYSMGLDKRVSGGKHPLNFIFERLRSCLIYAIPTTGFDRDDAYNRAVKEIIALDNKGVCIRLLKDDIDNVTQCHRDLTDLLGFLKVPCKNAHLLIDLRAIQAKEIELYKEQVLNFINTLPGIADWKSLILSASAFPSSLSGLKKDSISKIDRTEYKLWKNILAANPNRIPLYSDYGIVHADILEIDPRSMDASAKIRYTLEEHWLVLKGSSLKKSTEKFRQYFDLSSRLKNNPEFMGAKYSEGDNYIQKCADKLVKSGNLETWIKNDTIHHVTVVAEQLASVS